MNDKTIIIAIGNNRKSKSWRNEQTTVSALYARLSQPIISTETYAEYMKMPKSQQDDLKDVGGFMGGALNGTRRTAASVISRDIVTLDFDNIPGWQTDAITAKVDSLGCSYCIYSTRKHIPSKPRLRIIIPLDRTVSADEYEPITRRLAQHIGIEMADKTTFDVSRLMYWPSRCSDAEFYYKCKDANFISANAILGTYIDWHDCASWPTVPGAVSYQKLAVKQGDPLKKTGAVGAFCRTYTIEQAMEKFLPGIYEAVDNSIDRYTYLGGSTTGGAIIYDSKFLYSHHATDPCCGKLVNAFDLVRLHKFSDLDTDKEPNTPITKMPSFIQMCELAVNDRSCKVTLNKERQAQATKDFDGVTVDDTDLDWVEELDYNARGDAVKNTINNYFIILNNDPALKGKFAFNAFAGKREILDSVPWDTATSRRTWSDSDDSGLYWYIEKAYNNAGRGNIDSALSMYMAQHSFNEVQDFINGLTWDGVKRLDTLFIDYLGAEDCPYTRTVTRKMFVAAIARAMTPGVKFDNMLILVGKQGLGKSTLLSKMAKGWFNDSICTFEGKEAAELLQGIWLVEISELDAFRKSETSRIKQFLSLNSDIFRAAYAHNAEERKRRCVFFGTTNTSEFLRDPTGERRFWPIDCDKSRIKKSVWSDLDEDCINQLWAEAKAYWQVGEPLNLDEEIEQAANDKQQEHKESSIRDGLVREFISRKVPEDWQDYSIDRRKLYWSSSSSVTQNESTGIKLVERDRISAVEIWCECLGGDVKFMRQSDTREINAIIEGIPDWEKPKNAIRCGPYDRQRGFTRKK